MGTVSPTSSIGWHTREGIPAGMQPRAVPTHPMDREDWDIPISFPNHHPRGALVTPIPYLFSLVSPPTLLLHTLGAGAGLGCRVWTSSWQSL